MGQDFRILVADDDSENLLLMTSVLQRAGFQVLTSKTGGECLNAAMAYHPSLVLLDVMLPDMSGTEVCRQIKSSPELGETFVILISGVRVTSDYQADGLNMGADGYIIKPISNRELVARVQAMERIKDAEGALRKSEKEQQELVSKLRTILAEVKTLRGLIPICASCKKIRNDQGFWDQVESYLDEHTDAIFTHGLCPECFNKTIAGINERRAQNPE
jgi:DNA-binding response OmpR family regulator